MADRHTLSEADARHLQLLRALAELLDEQSEDRRPGPRVARLARKLRSIHQAFERDRGVLEAQVASEFLRSEEAALLEQHAGLLLSLHQRIRLAEKRLAPPFVEARAIRGELLRHMAYAVYGHEHLEQVVRHRRRERRDEELGVTLQTLARMARTHPELIEGRTALEAELVSKAWSTGTVLLEWMAEDGEVEAMRLRLNQLYNYTHGLAEHVRKVAELVLDAEAFEDYPSLSAHVPQARPRPQPEVEPTAEPAPAPRADAANED